MLPLQKVITSSQYCRQTAEPPSSAASDVARAPSGPASAPACPAVPPAAPAVLPSTDIVPLAPAPVTPVAPPDPASGPADRVGSSYASWMPSTCEQAVAPHASPRTPKM